MNALQILHRRLSGRSKLLLVLFIIMSLGFIAFLTSPFLLIWVNWDLAWRIGATGLVTTLIFLVGWWFLYNSFYTTIDAIRHDTEIR